MSKSEELKEDGPPPLYTYEELARLSVHRKYFQVHGAFGNHCRPTAETNQTTHIHTVNYILYKDYKISCFFTVLNSKLFFRRLKVLTFQAGAD